MYHFREKICRKTMLTFLFIAAKHLNIKLHVITFIKVKKIIILHKKKIYIIKHIKTYDEQTSNNMK